MRALSWIVAVFRDSRPQQQRPRLFGTVARVLVCEPLLGASLVRIIGKARKVFKRRSCIRHLVRLQTQFGPTSLGASQTRSYDNANCSTKGNEAANIHYAPFVQHETPWLSSLTACPRLHSIRHACFSAGH